MAFKFADVILQFLRDHPGLSAVNFVLALVVTPLNEILLPHLYGMLVRAIERGESISVALVCILAVLGFVQLGWLLKDVIDMKTQPRLFDYVKTRMVNSIVEKYDGYLVEPKTGRVISKIVRSPDVLTWWTSCILDYFIPQTFAIVAALCYFLYYDALLASTLLLMLGTICVLVYVAPVRCIAPSIWREETLDAVHEDIEDLLRNLVSVYSNDTAAVELGRLHRSGEKFTRANAATIACMVKFNAIGVPLIVLFILCIVTRCVHLIRAGRLQTGTFVSIFMMATSMIHTLQWLVSIVGKSVVDIGTIIDAEKMLSREHVDGFAGPQESLKSAKDARPLASGIGFSKVTFTHAATAQPVIKDATLHFERGQWTVITGNIGSGKSTILKLLMAFITPQQGDLYIDGRWYAELAPRDVRRRVVYMPQEAVLFDRPIIENVLYGSTARTVDDVRRAVKDLGLDAAFADLPEGLNTPAGKNGTRLSGGQRQLVWFLRIALRDPHYIIMDEPTASMDVETKEALLRALRIMARDKTVIMVTHDRDLLRFATRRVEWDKHRA
jgi:ABC-type bacteriocin/lantibiotic exporter with double-glycine peptidase domain